MTPQEAIDTINASQHTTYALASDALSFQGGTLATGPDGARVVVKTSRNPLWLKQVERAKAATGHLRTLGYPVPDYIMMGSNDRGTYWLQAEMPGEKAANTPTVEQIAAVLALIELQKSQVISEVQGQDWCWYLMDVVFRGEAGNVRALMQFSHETSALVSEIERLVAGLQGKVLPKTDLVHGDLSLDQVLFQGPTVTAVLGWEQVGYGDRTMDYIGLWYSLLNAPASRDLVMKRMLEISDIQAIKILAANKMLADLSWNINTAGGDVASAAAQARLALEVLHQI